MFHAPQHVGLLSNHGAGGGGSTMADKRSNSHPHFDECNAPMIEICRLILLPKRLWYSSVQPMCME